jgi:cytochrome P450
MLQAFFDRMKGSELHLDSSLVILSAPLILGTLIFINLSGPRSIQERSLANLPRPNSTLPFFGNSLDVGFKHHERFMDWISDECQKTHGKPWLLRIVGRPLAVVVSSAQAMEDVLKTHFDSFDKGPIDHYVLQDVLGDGIFAVDGAKWYHQRKIASHLFSHHMMRDVMTKIIREKTQILCEILKKHSDTGKEINLADVFDRFTTDVFTKIGFGVELRSLDEGKCQEYLDALRGISIHIIDRLLVPVWMWELKKYLNIGSEKKLQAHLKVVNDMAFDIIQRSIQAHQQRLHLANIQSKDTYQHDDEDEEKEDKVSRFEEDVDLVTLFLRENLTENSTEPIDPRVIRDLTVNFMFAGRDTTSQSMAWLLLSVLKYPKVLIKIRQEIQEQIPDLYSGKIQVPSMDQVDKLVYLEAAIRESQRLNPVVAINGRTANKNVTLSDNTFIPKGVRVMFSFYALARLQNEWGPDAQSFNPDRWIDQKTKRIVQVSPFKFTAFHAGPRMCLGMKFALLEMKIAIAALFSRFDFETLKHPQEFTYDIAITTPVKGPILTRISTYI